MTMKLPAFQFYPGDWLKDPELSMCAPATRGIWIDILCAMHELGRSGQVTGTVDQLCRLCRCTAAEMSAALTELTNTKAALTSERNGVVTVINRRMQREHKERVAGKERVKKYRSNGNVTDEKRNGNAPSSSSVSSSKKEPALRAVESPSSESHKRLMAELQNRDGPISDGAAQGQAVKWLLEHDYGEAVCVECLDALRSEDWRKGRVSWLNVKKEIGAWLSKRKAPPKERPMVL
jgi:hypothetical protein